MLHKKDEKVDEPVLADGNASAVKDEKGAERDAENEEKAAKKDGKAREAKPLSRTAIESRRHVGAGVLLFLLAIASIVAVLLPSWGIPLGCDLGGANAVTLTADDLGDASIDDLLAKLKLRADALEQHDLQLSKAGDDAVELRVPKDYDANAVADALTRVGHLELARLDSISDADALQKIQNNAENVTLEPGTYEAFATSDNVRDASVATQSYYGMTYYAVTLTLDADGTSALASVTDELSSSSGQIAVIVDGTVVATPSVSSKIENGKMNVAGGFTEDQAYAYAAAFKSGELPCTLSQNEPAEVEGLVGGDAVESVTLLWGAILVIAAIAWACSIRPCKRAARVVAELPAVSAVLSLGILTILARFDLVVLGRAELVGIFAMELAGIIAAVLMARAYVQGRSKGLSVRKSCQQAEQVALHRSLAAALAVIVVFVVLAVVRGGFARELACGVCCGAAGLLVTYAIYGPASLAISTAEDAEQTADEQLGATSRDGE